MRAGTSDGGFVNKGEALATDMEPHLYNQYRDGNFGPYRQPSRLGCHVRHTNFFNLFNGTMSFIMSYNGLSIPANISDGITANISETGQGYLPVNVFIQRTFITDVEAFCFVPKPHNNKDYRFFIYESSATTPSIQDGLVFAAQGSFTSGEKTVNRYEFLRVSETVNIEPAPNSVAVLFYLDK